MLVDDGSITLTFVSPGRIDLDWTGTADRDAYVLVDRQLRRGPLEFDAAAGRSQDDVRHDADILRLEIHEAVEAGEEIESLEIDRIQRPTIRWSYSSLARTYRIYRRITRTGDDETLQDERHRDDARRYAVRARRDLAGSDGPEWNFFRVTAIDEDEQESANTDIIGVYVEALPPKPATAAITGALGIFSLALTV